MDENSLASQIEALNTKMLMDARHFGEAVCRIVVETAQIQALNTLLDHRQHEQNKFLMRVCELLPPPEPQHLEPPPSPQYQQAYDNDFENDFPSFVRPRQAAE